MITNEIMQQLINGCEKHNMTIDKQSIAPRAIWLKVNKAITTLTWITKLGFDINQIQVDNTNSIYIMITL